MSEVQALDSSPTWVLSPASPSHQPLWISGPARVTAGPSLAVGHGNHPQSCTRPARRPEHLTTLEPPVLRWLGRSGRAGPLGGATVTSRRVPQPHSGVRRAAQDRRPSDRLKPSGEEAMPAPGDVTTERHAGDRRRKRPPLLLHHRPELLPDALQRCPRSPAGARPPCPGWHRASSPRGAAGTSSRVRLSPGVRRNPSCVAWRPRGPPGLCGLPAAGAGPVTGICGLCWGRGPGQGLRGRFQAWGGLAGGLPHVAAPSKAEEGRSCGHSRVELSRRHLNVSGLRPRSPYSSLAPHGVKEPVAPVGPHPGFSAASSTDFRPSGRPAAATPPGTVLPRPAPAHRCPVPGPRTGCCAVTRACPPGPAPRAHAEGQTRGRRGRGPGGGRSFPSQESHCEERAGSPRQPPE